MICPLCSAAQVRCFFTKKIPHYGMREFWQCPNCSLVFVPSAFHLSIEEEKKRYDSHQNSPDQKGYVDFLNRLLLPLETKLKPTDRGLDYGSGPGPTTSVLLGQKGYEVENYDPLYCLREELDPYDFITCSEVIEHFRNPAEDFKKIDRLLKPGGFLGVMTQFLPPSEKFSLWWYHGDPTHIAFYEEATFQWLAKRYDWVLEFPTSNLVLIQKASVSS